MTESNPPLPLPWSGESWYLTADRTAWMDARRSTQDVSQVSFFASVDHAAVSRRTRMRPGRFLNRYYGDRLTEHEIRYWVAQYEITQRLAANQTEWDPTLKLAATEDEIEYVYTHGCYSCMSYAADYFASRVLDDNGESIPYHPTRVYAAGDLQVAYLTGDGFSDMPEIAARALVWPEKLVYGRVYPTVGNHGEDYTRESAQNACDMLVTRLEAAGYTACFGGFDGAKLLRVENKNGGLIVPYLDGGYYVAENGKNYLEINHNADGVCANTIDGVLNVDLDRCEDCDSTHDCETITINGRHQILCQSCRSELLPCGNCGDFMRPEDTTLVNATFGHPHNSVFGQDWCSDCAENDAFICSGTNEYYSSQCRFLEIDGEIYSQDWCNQNAYQCEATDTWHLSDDDGVKLFDDRWVCQDWFDENCFTCPIKEESYENKDRHPDDMRVHRSVDLTNPDVIATLADLPVTPTMLGLGRIESPNQTGMESI